MIPMSDPRGVAARQGVPVLLSVAATPANLPVIRTLVESVLLTADFSLADASDVQLGVDEICTQIIARSAESDRLTCSLSIDPVEVSGEISGTLRGALELSTDGFGWHVVQSVTDAVDVAVSGSGDDRVVLVRFSKVRTSP